MSAHWCGRCLPFPLQAPPPSRSTFTDTIRPNRLVTRRSPSGGPSLQRATLPSPTSAYSTASRRPRSAEATRSASSAQRQEACWSRPAPPAALPRPSTTSSGSRRLPAAHLRAGQTYFIGALFATSSHALLFPGVRTGFTTSSDISCPANQFAVGGSLTFPGSSARGRSRVLCARTSGSISDQSVPAPASLRPPSAQAWCRWRGAPIVVGPNAERGSAGQYNLTRRRRCFVKRKELSSRPPRYLIRILACLCMGSTRQLVSPGSSRESVHHSDATHRTRRVRLRVPANPRQPLQMVTPAESRLLPT